jgi:hypothetical protein
MPQQITEYLHEYVVAGSWHFRVSQVFLKSEWAKTPLGVILKVQLHWSSSIVCLVSATIEPCAGWK